MLAFLCEKRTIHLFKLAPHYCSHTVGFAPQKYSRLGCESSNTCIEWSSAGHCIYRAEVYIEYALQRDEFKSHYQTPCIGYDVLSLLCSSG